MGLLDSVIGALGQVQGQGGAGGGQGNLLKLVLGMLAQGGQGGAGGAGGAGGLAGLVEKFQQGGLGEIAQSWVGTGQNLPISAEQLSGVLGKDTIAGMAGQLGLNSGDLLGQLTQMLPQVVDKLTPQGQIPRGDIGASGALGALSGAGGLGDLAGMLGGFLRR